MAITTISALNARVLGDGPRTLLFAHGFGGDQSVWAPYARAFEGRYRVILYDLASAGTANPGYFDPMQHSKLEGHAEDLLTVMKTFKVKDCLFVGHSVSGMIGLLAARQEPERFAKAILIGASPRYLEDAGYPGGLKSGDITATFEAIAGNYREWARNYAAFATSLPIDDPLAVTFSEGLMAMRPDIALVTLQAILRSDYRHILPDVAMPTVVLQTKRDGAVPHEVAQYLAAHLPGSKLEIINTEGHLPHLAAPGLVRDALERHLSFQ